MMDMNCSWKFLTSVCIISILLGSCSAYENVCLVDAQEDNEKNQMTLQVDVTNATGRPIPETLFGIFFEVLHDFMIFLAVYVVTKFIFKRNLGLTLIFL